MKIRLVIQGISGENPYIDVDSAQLRQEENLPTGGLVCRYEVMGRRGGRATIVLTENEDTVSREHALWGWDERSECWLIRPASDVELGEEKRKLELYRWQEVKEGDRLCFGVLQVRLEEPPMLPSEEPPPKTRILEPRTRMVREQRYSMAALLQNLEKLISDSDGRAISEPKDRVEKVGRWTMEAFKNSVVHDFLEVRLEIKALNQVAGAAGTTHTFLGQNPERPLSSAVGREKALEEGLILCALDPLGCHALARRWTGFGGHVWLEPKLDRPFSEEERFLFHTLFDLLRQHTSFIFGIGRRGASRQAEDIQTLVEIASSKEGTLPFGDRKKLAALPLVVELCRDQTQQEAAECIGFTDRAFREYKKDIERLLGKDLVKKFWRSK